MAKLFANNGDPDLHCSQITLFGSPDYKLLKGSTKSSDMEGLYQTVSTCCPVPASTSRRYYYYTSFPPMRFNNNYLKLFSACEVQEQLLI